MPHDANARDKGTGKTYVSTAQDAGLDHIRVVHRTPDIWLGINQLRAMLPRCYVHAVNCTQTFEDKELDLTIPSGLDCLDNYHKKVETTSGVICEVPVHDRYSHGASALRTMSEASRLGMLEGTSYTAQQNRDTPVRVLRGAGPESYSVRGGSPFRRTALR